MPNEKILIIGLGLIGRQRLDACIEFGIPPENISVFDANLPQISFVKESAYEKVTLLDDLKVIPKAKFDRAIIAVPHDIATTLVVSLLDAGSRVLLEKPLGRNIFEAQRLASHSKAKNLSVGFNYRFMPGVIRLKEALDNHDLGDISTLKMELGHGGGPKDQGSWKLDPVRAGGGVLLDPGIHLIDLLVFLFDATVDRVSMVGKTEWKGFWNTGVVESSQLIGYVTTTPFSIASSIVAWRTRFKIEVIGTEKYFEVDGRGRSDGPQTITVGSKWGWLSSPSQKSSEESAELSVKDRSLCDETFAWLTGDESVCNIYQALEGMKIYSRALGSTDES